jgi:hypothetical protein
MAHTDLVADFKTKLNTLSANDVVDFITDQSFSNGIAIEQANYLRNNIASRLHIEANSVLLVGSAKLGFSISQKKDRLTNEIIKPRYRSFNEDSDLDFAIVNSDLFDEYWEKIFNIYCQANTWQKINQFQHFFFRGWIRPDLFPESFKEGVAWWGLFSNLSRDVNVRRKVRGGLYKSSFFLDRYQGICVNDCLTEIKLEVI